ncbi:MAG: multiheme c-type cytochrome, partial [Bacteroidales bacterium]|nr:multiheme c-type cytochrome [Bacteroidales bacterium]
TPHSAEGKAAVRYSIDEEENCLVCHNGNVASTNIADEMNKAYSHNVEGYNMVHDPAESELVSTIHAECEDCHNPHAANNTTASAPDVSGRLAGVKGVNIAGSDVNPAIYEYEICFRCHSSTPLRPEGNTTRQIEQTNTRLEFIPGNPSFHPIASIGQNTDVPSLIAPDYSESSIIYCTDCHASDGVSAPAGPHGSSIQSLLKYVFNTADYTVESVENYALCYSCHSRTSILGDESFYYHYLHIVEENSPCNSCHDPHGISSTQGTTTNNSHLINFDISIVTANGAQNVRFVDTGYEEGYCILRCHSKGHGTTKRYPPPV